MKVKFVGWGLLVNENGEYFTDDGWGNIMNVETGEIYTRIVRNENDEIIEIG